MKKIKHILLSILGRKNYLILTSRVFLLAYKLGWLRNDPAYFTHYFVRHFIKPGQTVIDIGANLGYYSCQFAQWVGPTGQVLSVEPVPVYRQILEVNTSRFPQVKILPYALAEHEGVGTMGIPGSDRHRHGLMRMLTDKEKNQVTEKEEVQLKNPADLFAGLAKIHYIKCDIEGYEIPVLPLMWDIIAQRRPVVQVETEGENKQILFEKFRSSGFQMFYVDRELLHPYHDPAMLLPADLIAIPSEMVNKYQQFIIHA